MNTAKHSVTFIRRLEHVNVITGVCVSGGELVSNVGHFQFQLGKMFSAHPTNLGPYAYAQQASSSQLKKLARYLTYTQVRLLLFGYTVISYITIAYTDISYITTGYTVISYITINIYNRTTSRLHILYVILIISADNIEIEIEREKYITE